MSMIKSDFMREARESLRVALALLERGRKREAMRWLEYALEEVERSKHAPA